MASDGVGKFFSTDMDVGNEEDLDNDHIRVGYLTKLGAKIKNWKRRWCILTKDGKLFYYKNKTSEYIKEVPIKGVEIRDCPFKEKKKDFCWKILTRKRVWFFYADNEVDQIRWLKALEIAGGKMKIKKSPVKVVVEKLATTYGWSASLEYYEAKARVLTDPKLLREEYLNYDWAKAKKQYDELNALKARKQKKRDVFKSLPQQQSSSTFQEEGDGLGTQDEFEKEAELFYSVYDPENNPKTSLSVKLVIAEIANTKGKKLLRKALSPIITTLGPYMDKKMPPFGIFHSALVIGPWYIEWVSSALCTPRKIMSGAAVMSCDLPRIKINAKNIKKAREILSNIICEWNSTKRYHNGGATSEKVIKNSDGSTSTQVGAGANCQDFVDEVLNRLDIDASTIRNGAMGAYLDTLRKEGTAKMQIKLTKEFKQKFGIKQSVVSFDTHIELDTFCLALQNKLKRVSIAYPSEWMLLKSFDRAFWLRHIKSPDISTYCQHEEGCPFKNPTETGSFNLALY